MKKYLAVLALLLLSLRVFSAVSVEQNPDKGLVFSADGEKELKVSLWDDSIKENSGFVSSGWSEDPVVIIPWDKIKPGQKLRVRTRTSAAANPDFYISAEAPVSVTLQHTGWLNGSRTVKGTYEVRGVFGGDMFAGPAAEYEPRLAKLAIMLCGSSYLRDGVPGTAPIQGLLEQLGCRDIRLYNYYGIEQKERSDKAGFSLGHRKVYIRGKDRDLVICTVRGTVAGEWFSNFDVGTGTGHKGFTAAAEDAVELVRDYIKACGISENAYFFMCGHSRGAAAASLISQQLQKHGTAPERLYTYVFACPNYVREKQAVKAPYIHEFLYEGDLVPAIPMWDFTTCGSRISSYDFTPDEKKLLKKTFADISDGVKCTAFTADEKASLVKSLTELAPDQAAFYEKVYSRRRVLTPKPMTTYQFCNEMGSVLVSEDVKRVPHIPAEFRGVIWAFVVNGGVSPKIIQSHSIEMYLALTEVYNQKLLGL